MFWFHLISLLFSIDLNTLGNIDYKLWGYIDREILIKSIADAWLKFQPSLPTDELFPDATKIDDSVNVRVKYNYLQSMIDEDEEYAPPDVMLGLVMVPS